MLYTFLTPPFFFPMISLSPTPLTILWAKNLSSCFYLTHESAWGLRQVTWWITLYCNEHMHKSTALKHQNVVIFLVFFHYSFTFFPLSALTCLSCDGTQAFFRNCWYSKGLGGSDHLISYLLPLLLKRPPPAFTFHLCSTRGLHHLHHLTISFTWHVIS